MLKQYIQGQRVHNADISASDGDIAKILPVLAGKVEVYRQTATGGTALPNPPMPLNAKKIIVGKKDVTGRLSTMLHLPHVNPAKNISDLETALIGNFDCGFETDVKCEYINLKFDALTGGSN